jgi:hypothetical protein
MKTALAVLTGLLILTAVLSETWAAEPLLTVPEVEKQTGLKGIKSKTEGNALHFYKKDGTLILTVQVEDRAAFRKYGDDKKQFRSLLPTIGYESVCGVPQMPHIIAFLTKKNSVLVKTYPWGGTRTHIAFLKLQELAKLVAPRI